MSFVSGALAYYGQGDTDWSVANTNFPVATGGWFATDPQSRAEIRIGADTIESRTIASSRSPIFETA